MAGQSGRRTALVTGASYGIGAAAAIGLAEDGFDVAVTDLATTPLSRTVAAIEAAGGRALPLALDLRQQASVEQAIADTVASFGALDVLVNNAGVPSPGRPAIELTRAEWDDNIAVNLTGTWFMSMHSAAIASAPGGRDASSAWPRRMARWAIPTPPPMALPRRGSVI